MPCCLHVRGTWHTSRPHIGHSLGPPQGWDRGVEGMRVGDRRKLTIPPSMAYGTKGAPPDIPPNAKLVFDVELVNVL